MELSELRRVARDAVGDAGRSGVTYWSDLLLSAATAWCGVAASLWDGLPFGARLGAGLVAALALYRAAYFVHEIAHFKQDTLPGFVLLWHALVGVPAGVPAFMAEMHRDHHRRATYGTSRDPEYADVATWGRLRILGSVLLMVVIPPLLFLRWALVTPLSFLHPKLRRLTEAYLSTLAINPSYERPAPSGDERRRWLTQELSCAVFAWGVTALVALEVLPIVWLATWWAILGVSLAVNQVKTLVTHAFELDADVGVTGMAQMLDSITVGGSWLSEIIAPLGNRHHAIHHMLPDVPYHHLPAIHRRLVEIGDAGYASTQRRGIGDALRVLWRRAALNA